MLEIMSNEAESSAKIIVIGVGGAGNNAVNRMVEEAIGGVEFVGVGSGLSSVTPGNIGNTYSYTAVGGFVGSTDYDAFFTNCTLGSSNGNIKLISDAGYTADGKDTAASEITKYNIVAVGGYIGSAGNRSNDKKYGYTFDSCKVVGNSNGTDIISSGYSAGGFVGDIESLPFLEAIRQVKKDVGKNDVLYIHVTLVPYISAAGELKTKPTQHSVKELRSIGISPDIIVCRSEKPISKEMREKMAMFCDVDPDAVIQNLTARSIYEVPMLMEEQGLDTIVLRKLEMEDKPKDMQGWHDMVARILKKYDKKVTIAVVGKYVALQDAYISITESLRHAAVANEAELDIHWVNAEEIEADDTDMAKVMAGVDGILVPGGFGNRGIEGKIKAIQYAREHKIPFFGICLGMQCAVIEFARHVCGMADANSSEFNPNSAHPVIDLMPEQIDVEDLGGTMRLGLYPCKVYPDTLTSKAYNAELIYERHRHRYEFNNAFREEIVGKGLVLGGTLPNGRLVEIVELPESEHPWFLGAQFHPEFKSRPTNPHPLFRDFVGAAVKHHQ